LPDASHQILRRALTIVMAALALLPAAAEAKTVRVITVGPRFDLSWVDSRADFEAKLDRMLAHAPRLGQDRDLAVMPEDLGLMAAFSGSRGAPARGVTAQTGGLTAAIGTLFGTYGEPSGYYASRFPELTTRGLPARLLAISLTDTFGRVAVESFAELADRHDVWLAAGVNMAREWRIVCRSRASFTPPPGATGCDEENPALVTALGDPDEPDRDYAYEAAVPEPVNMALLFDPDGRLVSKQVKAYLTPMEMPGQLDLVPGDPAGLTAVATPVGRLGFVTSKDAWMPDITGRLDDDRVEILVQPEFFVGDTVRRSGPWAPDTLKASAYSNLLRHPSLEAVALPELTGDVYDFSADAQSHIAVRPWPGGPRERLVGQHAAPGLAEVQDWLAPDPLGRSLRARRGVLGAAGEDAVGRGIQQEGVLWHDVEVGATAVRKPAPRVRDEPLSPSRRDQTDVDVAADQKTAYIAWEQNGHVRTMVSRDNAKTFRQPRDWGRGQNPSVSVGRGGSLWLAFERSDGKVAYAEDFGRAKKLARGGGVQERPDITALGSDGAFAAWIDDRQGVFGVYGGQVGDVPERLDQGEPAEPADQFDNAWAPSVAADGRKKVLVTWSDFRSFQWDVYSRFSEDRGESFQPQVRVNDTPADQEALNDTPQAGFLKSDPFVVWTDFRKTTTPQESSLYDIFGAVPGQPNRRLDADGDGQVDAFAPASVGLPDGRLAIVWQSHRGPTADIAMRVLRNGERIRVDDAGTRNVNSWRPSIASLRHGRAIVAWEDDRDGPSNIFVSRLVLPSPSSP
jgi:predicted amidohydrolase